MYQSTTHLMKQQLLENLAMTYYWWLLLFCFVGVMNLVVTATGDHDIKEKITAVSTTVSQEGVHVLNRFISKVDFS